ncbi:hypothetical protein VNI00_002837 [Paramarasmius palmivorus]|uniref:FAD-binding PCMH-type domain-containing protein n=1 Tax=Paramarasmius palmivorus TaxID=297713 RepID=A0AAW0DU23_9AGAR
MRARQLPFTALLACIEAILLSPVWALPSNSGLLPRSAVCSQIEHAISSKSGVYYHGDKLYEKGIHHWASSCEEESECVVEPGTAEDLGAVLRIIGSTRTPFAVKGGGHNGNKGFSSTTGVHISMYRFSEVSYDSSTRIATFGSGLVWDDVYAGLAPYSVSVAGGRVSGVGVGGFSTGGGYSWYTNQYGMTIDNIIAYDLVKPDGSFAHVTEQSDPELFFALKGGGNNFGVVTRFFMKTFPIGEVWGGVMISLGKDEMHQLAAATAKFSAENTDPKASIITTFGNLLAQPTTTTLLFYDGPTPPPGLFDDFLAVSAIDRDIKTRDFLSLVTSSPSNATTGTRGTFDTLSFHELTPGVLNAVVDEATYWGGELFLKGGLFVAYAVEPFLPDILTKGTYATAYPDSRSKRFLPSDIYFSWTLETWDSDFQAAIKNTTARLVEASVADGQTDVPYAPLYSNYAISDVPVERMYGENLDKLRAIRARVDPSNVMGLTGGFRI